MSRSPLLALVLLLGFTTVALAAEISGRWVGKISTPNGEIELVYHFQASGDTLTGSLATPNGDLPIQDGKVNGDDITFTLMFRDNPIAYRGTVAGDTLVLISEWGGQERAITLTRSPAQ